MSITCTHKGSCLSRRLLTIMLTKQFGNDLLVLSSSGVANLSVFRSKASSVLRLVDDDEDNVSSSVEILAKQIIRECRELKKDERYYQIRLNLDFPPHCTHRCLLHSLAILLLTV